MVEQLADITVEMAFRAFAMLVLIFGGMRLIGLILHATLGPKKARGEVMNDGWIVLIVVAVASAAVIWRTWVGRKGL